MTRHRDRAAYRASVRSGIFFAPPARLFPIFAAGSLALLLGGCGIPDWGAAAPTTLTVQDPDSVKYYPSDEPYRLGAEHFNRGQYGLAERYFRDAVEKAPEDGSAWVALASAYDRLSRFDLADNAYARAIALCGETVQILNNQGYSQMLRGNLKTARQKFLRAAALDPGNPTISNNIHLLDGWEPWLIQHQSASANQPPPAY